MGFPSIIRRAEWATPFSLHSSKIEERALSMRALENPFSTSGFPHDVFSGRTNRHVYMSFYGRKVVFIILAHLRGFALEWKLGITVNVVYNINEYERSSKNSDSFQNELFAL